MNIAAHLLSVESIFSFHIFSLAHDFFRYGNFGTCTYFLLFVVERQSIGNWDMKNSSPLIYLLRDPPENFDLFRGYDVFCILATGGNLWPPRGHYLCHCSMVNDDTSRNHNRKTDRASENPSGTPRQCISVCPWKLAQPIAGYRRNTRLILNPQWHKKAACSFSYLFCCAGALCTMLEFLFIFVLRELDTWTWTPY